MLSGCNRSLGSFSVSLFLLGAPDASWRVAARRVGVPQISGVSPPASRIALHRQLRAFVLPRLDYSVSRSQSAYRCVSARVAASAAASGRWRRPAAGVSTQSAAPRHVPHRRLPGSRRASASACHGGHRHGLCVSLRTCLCCQSSAHRQYTLLITRERFSRCVSVAHSLSRAPGGSFRKAAKVPRQPQIPEIHPLKNLSLPPREW